MRLMAHRPENQVNYQDSVDLFDSLTGGGEQEEDAIPTSFVDQQDEDWYATHLATVMATDGYRPATRQDFR